MEQAALLSLPDGSRLAYSHLEGSSPGILFCSGFNSDMQGNKAIALADWCRQQGRQFTRFDYFGHGQSDGKVEEGSIGRWRDDALAILDSVTHGPQLVVGSSMGGWVMLLVALARPERLCGLLGLAAAPDFTARLAQSLSAAQQQQLADTGYADLPNCSDDGQPYRVGLHMLQEAESHLLLAADIPVDLPVRLIHGQADEDVPWQLSFTLAERLRSADVEVQLVKSGDHRLSEPADLQRLRITVEQMLRE